MHIGYRSRYTKTSVKTENGNKYPKSAKLGQKGSRGGHVTHFWNFGTHLIYPERLKLETSNLTQRWTAVTTNKKMQN